MGQNGYGAGYGGEFSLIGTFLFEVIATAIFLVVILAITSETDNAAMAGLVIGLTLTMIHLVGITITGTSVNPTHSVGPALFVGGTALSQLWIFSAAPLIGAPSEACCTAPASPAPHLWMMLRRPRCPRLTAPAPKTAG